MLLRLRGGVDDERRRRALSVVGLFHSGFPDVSENHDRYPAEDYLA